MDNETYISPNKITKQYDITSGTLRRWSETGKIRCLRPNGGKRIYNIEDIKRIFNNETELKDKEEKKEKEENSNKNTDNMGPDHLDLKNVIENLKKNYDDFKNNNNINSLKLMETEMSVMMNLINGSK